MLLLILKSLKLISCQERFTAETLEVKLGKTPARDPFLPQWQFPPRLCTLT